MITRKSESAIQMAGMQAKNGGLVITIPEHAHVIELPPTIRLDTGDSVTIVNNDLVAHVVLGALVRPGTTDRRILTETGLQVYGAGCALHGHGGGLTTLIVGGGSS